MSERRSSWIAAAAVILLALPTLLYPLGPDQALFLVIGRAIRAGQLPYLDLVDVKPPLIFFLYALTPTMLAVRVLDLVLVLAMAWAVRELATLLLGEDRRPPVGQVVLATLGLYYGAFDYWCTAQVETAQGLTAILAIMLAARRRVLPAALAGLATGASLMLKPSLIAVVPGVMIVMSRTFPLRARARLAAAYGASAALALAAIMLPFVLRRGGVACIDDVLQWLAVYAKHDMGLSFSINGKRTGRFVIGFCIAIPLAAWFAYRRGHARPLGLAAALTAVAGLGIVAQHKYLNYHWVILTPFVASTVLVALSELPERRRMLALVAWVVLGIVPIRIEGNTKDSYHRAYARCLYETARTLLHGTQPSMDLHWGGFGNDVGPLVRASQKIDETREPGDTLCIRGFRTLPYVLTGLSCPSRFPWELHLAVDWSNPDAPPNPAAPPVSQRWTREHVAALAAHPPTYVLTLADALGDQRRLATTGYEEIYREATISLWRARH